jgi:ribosomal protein L11 methylase PrmA
MFFLTTSILLFAEVSVYAPTPLIVAERMLELIELKRGDTIFDLGSGDGRLLILASKIYKCEGVGIENDLELVERSRRNVINNGVNKWVTIRHQDVLEADLREADVILVYLMPELLRKLKPQFTSLKEGVRIVAHDKALPGVVVDEEYEIEVKEPKAKHYIYIYTTPLKEVKCKGGT